MTLHHKPFSSREKCPEASIPATIFMVVLDGASVGVGGAEEDCCGGESGTGRDRLRSKGRAVASDEMVS